MSKMAFPLVINAPKKNADIVQFLKYEKDALEQKLAEYGAVLYRGFDLVDAAVLDGLVKELSEKEFYNNEESSPRSQIAGNVYTSTNYRSDQEIFPHNENSYKKEFPMKLFFYCSQPSAEGGETPIVDCRKVLRRIEPEIVQKFVEKKWMYVRNFGNGVGIPWEEAFNTTDRTVVEKYCQEEDISFEWIGDNSLRTKQVREPVLKHPISGELSWFNHITFFNIAALENKIKTSLLSIFNTKDLPHNTYYGDGSVIDASVIEHLKQAYQAEAVNLKWEKGDLIVIDNLLTSHARKPFKGERSIMLAQADPVARSTMTMPKEKIFKKLKENNDLNKYKKNGSPIIIGLSFGYHDSSCAILKDGKLIAAVQEERFSRIKNDKSFPRKSLRYCLQEAGCNIDDVDCIAYYEDPKDKLSRQIWMGSIEQTDASRHKKIVRHVVEDSPIDVIRNTIGYDGPIEVMNHHLSHGASSFFFSGFNESAVLTVDGVGEWATTTYGHGNGNQLELLEEVHFPDSIGLLYSTITSYLGFKVNSGEYKVMGLAPYGKPLYVDKLRHLITLKEKGQYQLEMAYFEFLKSDRMYSNKLVELLGKPAREPESEIEQYHKDMAKSLQCVLEEILLKKIEYLYTLVPSDNLCMAGGVALNCVANARIRKEGPYKNLYVQPAAGDAGTALGAAALAHIKLAGTWSTNEPLPHVYLGPDFSSEEVHEVLEQSSMQYLDFRGREEALLTYTASELSKGKVIGWFQGRMEFGPRGLGARSILADPRIAEMRGKINALVKKREGFRPFAPAVLESKMLDHFELSTTSPFMLETCQVNSLLDLHAITHVDNSARVQTVGRDSNPRFRALLEKFDELTGCPILLNTSFNVRGEPVVCSIMDAIMCFVRAGVDYLVIEDFVLKQSSVPPLWKMAIENTPLTKQYDDSAPGHLVYTFL